MHFEMESYCPAPHNCEELFIVRRIVSDCAERRGTVRKMDGYLSGTTPGSSIFMLHMADDEKHGHVSRGENPAGRIWGQEDAGGIPSYLPDVKSSRFVFCDRYIDVYSDTREDLFIF